MDKNRCYTIKDLQKILRTRRQTIYELLKKKPFAYVRIGTNYRISKRSFDEWLDRNNGC